MNLFSNEIITQKSESSENDDFTPNNEQTIHDLSHIIDINSNEYNFSSKTSINIFLDYIDNILKLESTCLILKESLALREDITFKELFCLFDYHKNKNISVHEFKKVCKNILGLYPTTDQVTLIFKRYDMNKDEKLDLKEFLNMISPIKKEYLSILFGDKRIQKPFRSELSDKSKKIIENLTKAIILNETNYYEIKEKMRMNNFNKKEVWNILMQFSKNKNYLNKKNFDRFLKAHSYYLTSYENDIIFNKFDFDKDNHLSMNDFNHEFNF
jgi:Ca2+-binding EF-hand superfamily protein